MVLIKNVFVPVIKEVGNGISCLIVLSFNHCMLNAKNVGGIYKYKDGYFYTIKKSEDI